MSEKTKKLPSVITLRPSGEGRFEAQSNDASALEQVDGMQMKYTEIGRFEDSNVSFARGHVPANGTVPSHAADTHYAFYVLAGRGDLTLHHEDGTETSRIAYKPGDLILFPPKSYHGWVNRGEDLEWFGVDISR